MTAIQEQCLVTLRPVPQERGRPLWDSRIPFTALPCWQAIQLATQGLPTLSTALRATIRSHQTSPMRLFLGTEATIRSYFLVTSAMRTSQTFSRPTMYSNLAIMFLRVLLTCSRMPLRLDLM